LSCDEQFNIKGSKNQKGGDGLYYKDKTLIESHKERKTMKKNKLKRICILSFSLTVLVLLGAQMGTFAQPKMVLELPSYQATEPGFADWWKEAVKEFEATHPNVQINLISVPYRDHHDKLMTRFVAMNPPEITHISSRFFFGFADRGFLEPLDGYMKGTDIKEVWTPMQQVMVRKGKTYGILLLSYAYGLYYNEKMFKEAGLVLPTTMAEVAEISKILTRDTNGDGIVDQYGISLPIIDGSALYMSIIRFLIGEGSHWTKDGKIAANSPEVIKTLNLFKEIAGASPVGLGDPERRVYFFEGKAAMLIDGSWVLAMKHEAPENIRQYVKVALPPFPIMPGGPSNNVSIPRDISKEKKDVVWEFMYMLTRPKWQESYGWYTGNPPPRAGSLTDKVLERSPELKTFEEAMNQAKASYLPTGFEEQFSEFSKFVTSAVMEIVTTDRAVEDVVNELQRSLEKKFL
jgi:multiple sugar transport system substrate-binding protein